MDVEDYSRSVDPLALSLDEVIKLNKLRNQQLQEVEEPPLQLDIKTKKSFLTNGHDNNIVSLLNSPSSASTPKPSVRERLGWKPYHRRYIGKTMAQNHALRAIRNAQQFKTRPPMKNNTRAIRNNDSMMLPPLTTSVLRKHNKANGNFMVKTRNNNAPSVYSSLSTQSTAFFRHSSKKCLNPEIQQILCNLRDDDQPCAVFGAGQIKLRVDHSYLHQFKPKVQTTSLPTHVRFVIND